MIAQKLLNEVFEYRDDQWRGLGSDTAKRTENQ